MWTIYSWASLLAQRQGYNRVQELDALRKIYEINDLGPVRFSLGLRVTQCDRLRLTTIDQRPLIEEIEQQYSGEIPAPHKGTVRCMPYDDTIDENTQSDPDSAERWARGVDAACHWEAS